MQKKSNNNQYLHLADLIRKVVSRTDDENDRKELEFILEKNKYSEELINDLSSAKNFKAMSEILEAAYERRNEDAFVARLNQSKVKRTHQHRLLIALGSSVAAVLTAFSFYLFTDWDISTPVDTYVVAVNNTYTQPTLILNENQVIEIKSEDKKIDTKEYKEISSKESRLQKLVIPYGDTYSVLLDDSTEVFLNSNSELLYPSSFSSDKREVEIKGEAFFRVKKSNIPFIVKAGESYIKVYGTSFNVNCRQADRVKTVLVSGSVGVGAKDIKEIKIKPNQMAILDLAKGEGHVEEVDATLYSAWINQYMIYNESDFADMLIDMSNWYNISFEYNKEELSKLKVSLSIKRPDNLENLIQLIEEIIHIQFIEKKGGIYQIERVQN